VPAKTQHADSERRVPDSVDADATKASSGAPTAGTSASAPPPSATPADISAALGTRASVTPVSEVAERLLAYFTSGQIAAGTRLPSERQLSASLGVGRSAVREALAALEILGIVVVRPGSGTYLRDSASELLPRTLSWGMMLGAPRTRELVELRGGLEVQVVSLAAERITDEGLERLAEHLDAMRASRGDLAAFVEADARFHGEIASSAGNQVLRELLQSIRSLLRIWADRALEGEDDAATAVSEHAAIFAAVRDRDADAAASAMAAHMATAAARLLANFDAANGSGV
jgi:GntR family transcriptional repressor for pyruvate dehydrogenase complex